MASPWDPWGSCGPRAIYANSRSTALMVALCNYVGFRMLGCGPMGGPWGPRGAQGASKSSLESNPNGSKSPTGPQGGGLSL